MMTKIMGNKTLLGGSPHRQRADTEFPVGGQDVLGRSSNCKNLGGNVHRAQGGKGARIKP
jgi:hypothetical protein